MSCLLDRDVRNVGNCPDRFPWGGGGHGAKEVKAARQPGERVREELEDLCGAGRALPEPATRPMREAVILNPAVELAAKERKEHRARPFGQLALILFGFACSAAVAGDDLWPCYPIVGSVGDIADGMACSGGNQIQ